MISKKEEEESRIGVGMIIPNRDREELVAKHEALEAMKPVLNDFVEALNIIQDYQRVVRLLCSPDPNILRARSLLQKYNREHLETHPAFKILLGGRDITDYPEIEATATEMELEPGE